MMGSFFNRGRWLGLAVLGLALPACITMGRTFDTQRVPSIVIGKTTQAEVRRQFGEPYRTGIESGDLTWTCVFRGCRAVVSEHAEHRFGHGERRRVGAKRRWRHEFTEDLPLFATFPSLTLTAAQRM